MPAASGGGLAGSLHPLVEGTGATWVASSHERGRPAGRGPGPDGRRRLRIELVEPEPDVYNLAYNVVSNATLWFCHHHLFDSARRPAHRPAVDGGLGRLPHLQPADGRAGGQGGTRGAPGAGPGLPPGPHGPGHWPTSGPTCARPTSPTPPSPTRRSCGCCPTAVGDELLAAMARLRRLRLPLGPVGRRLPGRPRRRRRPRRRATPDLRGPAVDRRRAGCGVGRGAGRRRRPGPIEDVGRWGRPPGDRPGRPDGAVEEPAPRVLGLRRAARAGAGAPRAGGVRGPRLSAPARACPSTSPTRTRWRPRWPGSTSGGGPRGGPRSCSRWRTTTPRSLAALTRYDVLLVNPVRDGLNLVAMEGPLVNDTGRGPGPVPRGRGLRPAGRRRPRDQPVRRDRHGRRCWPGRWPSEPRSGPPGPGRCATPSRRAGPPTGSPTSWPPPAEHAGRRIDRCRPAR